MHDTAGSNRASVLHCLNWQSPAQTELAEHLAALGHLVSATPETLLQALQGLGSARLVPYEKGSPAGIVADIDRLMRGA